MAGGGPERPTDFDRLPNFDLFRGVAAFMVVAGHAYALGGRTPLLAAEQLVDLLVVPLSFGIYLFFIMSGAVISRPFLDALVTGRPLPDIGGYLVRRAFRIYPLYLAVLAVVLAVAGRGELGGKSTVAVTALLHNLVPQRQAALISVAWTLSIEVLFYLSVPVLAIIVRVMTRGRPLAAETLARGCLVLGFVSLGWMVMGELAGGVSFSLAVYLRTLIFGMWWAFVPGMLLILERLSDTPGPILGLVRRIRTERTLVPRVLVALAPVALLGLLAQDEWGVRPFLFVFDATRVVWTLAFAVVVIHWADRPTPESRIPRVSYWAGALSYGLYLSHGAFLYLVEVTELSRIVPLPHGGFGPYLVHLVFLSAIALAAAWIGWHAVEVPCNRLGRRWSRRARPPDAVAPAV